MANIAPFIENIDGLSSSEINGNDAREIVINCLKLINEDGPDAQTFRGLTADKYAKSGKGIGSMYYKMTAIYAKIHKDENPNSESENLLMTKGIIKLTGRMSQYETS